MNPVLIACSCYAGDAPSVERHLPLMQQHGAPVLILSPVDKPVLQLPSAPQGVYYEQAGEAEWAGPKALERHKGYMRILLRAPYDRYLLHDADSICLSAILPDYLWSGDWWSNEVADTNTGVSLLPKIAQQPPYAFTRQVLERIVAVLDRPATSYVQPTADGDMPVPTNCPDHLCLQLCHAAGVEHRSFPDGASWETESELGLREMARKAREEGTTFIHSVKSPKALMTLKQARHDYLASLTRFRP